MHHTRPRAARGPAVFRSRSLLTLAATTGPGQAKMAGMARQVVFPLWVGPTITTDCAGSAARAVGRNTPGTVPSTSLPGGGWHGRTRSTRSSRRRAQRHREWRRVGARWTIPASRYEKPASSAPPSATGRTVATRPVTADAPSSPRPC